MTCLLSKPELGADTITARPYQLEAIEATRRELKTHRSTCVIHPTGLGKTVLFSKIARLTVEKGNRALILAHRGELIEQAADTLERVGILAGIEKAETYARSAFEPDVVVGTVQSFQRDRLASWPSDHFRLVIVDEAHHATATTYQKILNYFHAAKVLGVTATPDRADEDEIADVFESIAHEITIWDAMTAPPPGPYLCRLKFVQCDLEIDLRDIRTTGGDYNLGDLEKLIRPLIDKLANAIRQEAGDRPTIIFTPDVGSAQAMATALQTMNLTADWISGESQDRKAKINKYKDGETQYLCNCNLLTEGFDAPKTAAIALCRPTQSRNLYSQMVGRGTRPAKPDCLLIDFNYLTKKHDLVRPADLFDSMDTSDETAQIFNELLKERKGQDLVDVVEKARATQQERQVLRVQAHQREVKYRKVSYDPLSAADTLGIPVRGVVNAVNDPPSPKQCDLLKKFGVENPESLSRRRASRMIDVLLERRRKGLATMKQVSWAINKGVNPTVARAMSFDEAHAYLDTVFRKRA